MPLNCIVIPKQHWFDEDTNHFEYITKDVNLKLEHSLLSIKKWERKWHVCYLDENVEKTPVMLLDYIRCMCVDSNIEPKVFTRLTESDMQIITTYLRDSMTALNLPKVDDDDADRDQPVNELFYYYMFSLGIPKECEKWHFNELLSLIRMFTYKNKQAEDKAEKKSNSRNRKYKNKPKKENYIDPIAAAQINKARRKSLNSRG